MKKFLFSLMLCIVFAGYSFAQQDIIDIGQDIGKSASQVKADENDKDLFNILGTEKNAAEDTRNQDIKNEEKSENKGILDKISDYFFGEDIPVSEISKSQSETQEDFVSRLESIAEEGDLKTQKALAYMYLYGKNDFVTDYQKAFKYYEMAANQGDATALNNLGSLYFNGVGVPVNYQKAIELLEKAAAAGSSEAALNLGFIYLSGRNASSNATHAVELFKMSAEKNNVIAKFMLGYAYYKGFGIEKNMNKGAALVKEAADMDFDEAQYIIGYMYLNGFGIAKNYENARKYMQHAMRQGNMSAIMELARLETEGTQLAENPFDAYILYSIASVMGEKTAPEKRDAIEGKIKRENLPQAQSTAENFKPKASPITEYARKTFGKNIRRYIEENVKKK